MDELVAVSDLPVATVLGALPTIGAVAHVRTLVERPAEGRYRLWFPQEYGDSMAEAVLDAAEGIS